MYTRYAFIHLLKKVFLTLLCEQIEHKCNLKYIHLACMHAHMLMNISESHNIIKDVTRSNCMIIIIQCIFLLLLSKMVFSVASLLLVSSGDWWLKPFLNIVWLDIVILFYLIISKKIKIEANTMTYKLREHYSACITTMY